MPWNSHHLFLPARKGAGHDITRRWPTRRPSGLAASLRRLAIAAALGLAGIPGAGHVAEAQYFAIGKGGAPLEPYDVDYSYLSDSAKRISVFDNLHYVPLGASGAYLTFNAELREQFWSLNNATYALRAPIQNTYDLQRLIGSAYLHLDEDLAAFVQLGRFDSLDRINPSTTERDRGRVQQGFVELKEGFGAADVKVRGGRQEIALGSGRFVWVNDSSNVRTTHDGLHANAVFGNVSLDAAYTRPVTSVLDPFADFDQHAGAFGAAYLSETVLPNTHIDEYYFYRRNLGGQYSGLSGNEDRSTIGGRLWGKAGAMLYDGDFAYQFGTFNGRPISALGTSARTLYTFADIAWQPGIQLQGSYFSGGGGTSTQTIRTFSAPFPRPTLLNYIGLDTLENLVEGYPAFVINPAPNLAFRFGPEFLWRASINDAVYVSRTTPLPATMSAKDKASFIGTNLIATLQWNPISNINVFAEYLHELPGPAITLAGGKSVDAGVLQVSFRL